MAPLIVALVLAAFAILVVASSIRIVRQARVGVVERWGKYRASLTRGLHVITTMLDRITAVVDMRERVQRVELKSVDPPRTIQEAMEQQMRADRAKRATILQAEGDKQSAILRAEGLRQAQILNAEAEQQSNILRAEGEKKARALRAE